MKGQWGKLAGYFLGTALIASALTFLPPLLGGGSWLPDLISSEGKAIDQIFWGLVILSIVIFAIVGAVVVYSVVHFRAEPGDMSDGEHIHGNARMEMVWVVVPSIIVFVIGILSYIVLEDNEIGLYDEAAAKQPGAAEMVVDVRGFSFGWAFRYSDLDGEALGATGELDANSELVLPVDTVVRFDVLSCSGKEKLGRIREQTERELDSDHGEHEFGAIEPGICEQEWDLTTEDDVKAAREEAEMLHTINQKRADGDELTAEEQALWDAQPTFSGDRQYHDVNHAFWVPEARLKIDAVAGLRTFVQWQPTKVTGPEDHYQVVCAELCGAGHNGMRTDVCVVDGATFEWWTGLDEEARKAATCVNLRLFSCLDDIDDRDALLVETAKLTKEDPEATCEQAEEIAA